jgi:hypothetical protein
MQRVVFAFTFKGKKWRVVPGVFDCPHIAALVWDAFHGGQGVGIRAPNKVATEHQIEARLVVVSEAVMYYINSPSNSEIVASWLLWAETMDVPWAAKAHAKQLENQRLFNLYHHKQYLTNDEINDETNMPQ